MAWPYHLVDLTEAQKHERRLLLDRYGVYAQLSALVPILFYQLYRLAVWVSLARRRSKVKYSSVPSSPDLKHGRGSREGVLVRKWRTAKWWLEGEVGEGWGVRGLWVAGGLWGSWLGILCVMETGDGMYSFLVLVVIFVVDWSERGHSRRSFNTRILDTCHLLILNERIDLYFVQTISLKQLLKFIKLSLIMWQFSQ